MKKVTKKQFNEFKKECLRLQVVFGLLEYEIHFKHGDLQADNTWAEIGVNDEASSATIFLTDYDRDFKPATMKDLARHEMCHLLISRLEYMARCRYIRSEEIWTEDEKLTVKLTALLEKI